MLFNDLLEAGIIELGEFGQVMNISDDITEDLLQQQKVIVSGRRSGRANDARAAIARVIKPLNNIGDLGLRNLNSLHNFLALALLEEVDLLQLALQQRHEILLIVLGPFPARWLSSIWGGLGDIVGLESFLKLVVCDVEGMILPNHRRLEVLAEPGGWVSMRGSISEKDLRRQGIRKKRDSLSSHWQPLELNGTYLMMKKTTGKHSEERL